MPLPTPTNCWTEAEVDLANALANCASAQAFLGVETAAAAAEKIFGQDFDFGMLTGSVVGLDHNADELREFKAYFQVMSNFSQPTGRNGKAFQYQPFGTLMIFGERQVTEFDVSDAEEPRALELQMKNLAGNLLTEILAYIDQNGGPLIRQIEITTGPAWNSELDRPTNGLWQAVEYSLPWGFSE